MRKLFCGIVALFMTLSLSAHTGIPWDNSEGESGTNRDTLLPKPGIALFVEGIGKGYFSFNADFPIAFHHRLSIGFTQMDYDTELYEN